MFAAVRRRVDMKKKRWYISVNGCVVIESSRGVDFSRALSLLSAEKMILELISVMRKAFDMLFVHPRLSGTKGRSFSD